MGSEVTLDQYGGVSGSVALVVNSSPVDLPDVRMALDANGNKKIADALGQWINKIQAPTMRRRSRFGGILDRDKYLSPTTYFDKVRLAREALKDDVVGGAADGTEAMAIDHVSIECDDAYEEDVWNQIGGDLDLDGVFRKQWRALFTDSAATAAVWWGERTYKPRLKTERGNQVRKEFKLQVPLGITFFDSTKIVPIGSLMFGQERMAYAAEPLEAMVLDQIIARRDGITEPLRPPAIGTGRRPGRSATTGNGNAVSVVPINPLTITEADLYDPIVERLILGRYEPNLFEQQELLNDGVDDISNLYLLDFTSVSRHTLTRLDYDRFPEVRLESIFGLLDLKSQLQQMDRVHLVGGSHMIILITKGTDDHPAQPEEISALKASATTIASVPLIVGDHRLHVEIITPKLDITLDRDKWDTLDVRIFARAWGTFIPTGDDLGDPTKIGQVIGRNLGSRRKMMRRYWELNLLQAIRDRNPEAFTERAKIVFQPANIAFAFDAAWASFMLDLRQGGDIAHGTVLSQFGMSIADEARKVEREAKAYGRMFQENAPFNAFGQQAGGDDEDGDGAAPDPDNPDQPTPPTRVARRSGGRQEGGNRNGGGAAPGTGQGEEPTGRSRSGGGRRARTDSKKKKDT